MKLAKDSFNKGVLTLIKGTTIAQAIPIAITPILTRLYTPEDFGLYSVFVAIVSTIGVIICLRYDLAILLPKEEKDSVDLVFLSLLVNFCLSFSLMIFIILFNDSIIIFFKEPKLRLWLFFVPISIFFVGLFNSLNYYNTKTGNFKKISNSLIQKSSILALTQLSLGLFKGPSGLILGNINSNLFANYSLGANLIDGFSKKKEFPRKRKLRYLIKKYQDFPKYSAPSALANSLGTYLVNILISTYFSVATLGFYAFAQRLLGIPSMLIGNSISQVFVKAAVDEKNKFHTCHRVYLKTLLKLCAISIPTFLTLYFIIEDLFRIVFGEEWLIAGSYSKILLPLFCVRFISSPLSMVTTVFQKQKISLIFQLIFLFISVLSIIISKNNNWVISEFLTLYSTSLSLFFVIKIIVGYIISKNGG